MGSLSVLMKMGLFQMNGGTEENPEYQLGSPIFEKVIIHLDPDFYPGETFIIEVNDSSPEKTNSITHGDIVKGGKVVLNTQSLN